MESITISENETTYVVTTRAGSRKTAFGEFYIVGDYVQIGTSLFYKPDSVRKFDKNLDRP